MSTQSLQSISSHFGIDMPFRDVYQVTEKLGKGAFGSVWKAEHKVSGDEFAVKIIDRRYVFISSLLTFVCDELFVVTRSLHWIRLDL